MQHPLSVQFPGDVHARQYLKWGHERWLSGWMAGGHDFIYRKTIRLLMILLQLNERPRASRFGSFLPAVEVVNLMMDEGRKEAHRSDLSLTSLVVPAALLLFRLASHRK
ncbi:hypothetical protein E2C01_075794 [Portunus trituberculatus]|uniref:Uncharacterized protein n=1 Tax=Portunus trituberculatus TaxID=210409 RepID=A0A5B7IK33_PORTR|nr:hypothetical protein [Portunus trituberculatus]